MKNQPGRVKRLEGKIIPPKLSDDERMERLAFVIDHPEHAAILYGAQNVKRIHGLIEIAKRRKIAGLQDLKP